MDENPYAPPTGKSMIDHKPLQAERQMRLALGICIADMIITLLVLWPGNYLVFSWSFPQSGVDQGLIIMVGIFDFAFICVAYFVFALGLIAFQKAYLKSKAIR